MERLSLDTSVSTIELVTPPGQVSAASALSAALRSPQETEADRIRKQL